MNLEHVGAGCIALGILLFVAALAQPATVTDSSRTCVDNPWSYGQDCSTVEYQAPNPVRSQLFGAGVFTTFLGVVVYFAGGSRSGGGSGTAPPSTLGASRPSRGPDGGDGTDRSGVDRPRGDDSTTLRAQLDARTGGRRGSATDSSAARATSRADAGPSDGTTTDRTTHTASAGTSGRTVDSSPISTGGGGWLSAGAGAAASGLASAFLLSWLLGLVATVETGLVRILAFAALALPGVALYNRYWNGGAADEAPDETDARDAAGETDPYSGSESEGSR